MYYAAAAADAATSATACCLRRKQRKLSIDFAVVAVGVDRIAAAVVALQLLPKSGGRLRLQLRRCQASWTVEMG